MNTPEIEIMPTDPRSPAATTLIQKLSEELARRYGDEEEGSGNFKPEDVLVDRSGFLIGYREGRAIACGAFRPLEDQVAEIKRMFVVPECRGFGYAKAILKELEQLARKSGYLIARLETGTRQPEAIHLYERSGYIRIPNFGIYENNGWSVCFEKLIGNE